MRCVGPGLKRKPARRAAPRPSGHNSLFCRLRIETLEDRRLLTASYTPLSDIVVDSSVTPTALIVQFRPGESAVSSLAAYLSGTTTSQQWAIAPGMREVNLNGGVDLQSALAAYKNDANVLFAEPDYRIKVTDFPDDPPNDPSYPDQWGLNNTGQITGTGGADIHTPDAWRITTGSPSVVVAVIDTGVDYDHPDLYQNIWINQNEIPASRMQNLTDVDADGLITFKDLNDPINQGPGRITDINHDGLIDGSDILAPMIQIGGVDSGAGGWADGIDNDNNKSVDDLIGYNFVGHNNNPDDDYFHGTHVAGTIAAMTNNGIGVAGVAPNVQIMPLKFLNDQGAGSTSDAISALNYAVANGASISNNSYGGGPTSQAFQTAIQNAADHGHIFVAAAGNNGSDNDQSAFYPANYNVSNIVSVAATDAGDYLAYFSNFGKKTVDIGAPGVDIWSTLPTHMTQGMLDEGLVTDYGTLSGTSMATPHVAGAIALVRSLHPDWTADQVISQIMSTADQEPTLANTTVSGGRLNAAAALGFVAPDTTPPHIVKSDPTGVTKGPVDHFHFVFSEAIDPTTFDTNDVVSLNDQDGNPIGVSSVTPTAGTNKEFDLWFDPQSLPGAYTLVLGPHITDLAGNELDTNGDRIPGVDGDDDYTTTFTISGSTVFDSPNVPVAITGFDPIVSYLDIDQDIAIADVNVKMNLTFPRDGRIAISLVSPSGTTVMLSNRHGGRGANFQDTAFDDEADTPISQGTAPFAGSFQPDESLSAFDTQDALGSWQLVIQNLSTINTNGTLNSWSLEIAGDNTGGGGGGDPNDPPVPQDDTVTAIQDTPLTIQPDTLLANDTDPNGDPLTIVSVGNASGGTVVLNPDSTITFTPTSGGTALGSFQYAISDGVNTVSANVTVSIQPKYPWHNPNNPDDVNNDGFVFPNDALLVISWINAYGTTGVIGLSAGSATYYLDVVANNLVAPNDAVHVINTINAQNHSHSTNVMASDSGASAAPMSVSAAAALVSDASASDDDGLLDLGSDDSGSVKANSGSAIAAPVLLAGPTSSPTARPTPAALVAASILPTDAQPLDPAAIDACLASSDADTLLFPSKKGLV
jgi:subtilisin family serine protease/subtilisin-like proprotein convertase family protein